MKNENNRQILNLQRTIVVISILMFSIKLAAWLLTGSIAILTDALESVINIIAGVFTLYSLYLSFKPKDYNHPNGHGKIEFIAASVEGILISIAGIYILYESIFQLIKADYSIKQLNYGIILIGITGLINGFLGYITAKKGKAQNSLPLIAGGKHLLSDSYSTIALLLGLLLIYLTDILWLDSAIAIIFGVIIFYTGVKIIRTSIAGIMDEADEELINEFIELLNENRCDTWIDIHKIRFIKYGSELHLDCHLTVPWYFNLREAHKEYVKLRELANNHFNQSIDLFVHLDDCVTESCAICPNKTCQYREKAFVERVTWSFDNATKTIRHSIKSLK